MIEGESSRSEEECKSAEDGVQDPLRIYTIAQQNCVRTNNTTRNHNAQNVKTKAEMKKTYQFCIGSGPRHFSIHSIPGIPLLTTMMAILQGQHVTSLGRCNSDSNGRGVPSEMRSN
jgi:hypothetical protein